MPRAAPGEVDGAEMIVNGVPAVIGPAPGGFAFWQLLHILEATAERASSVGFNRVELMPSAGIGGRGALVAARSVTMVIGLAARQRIHSV